MWFLFLTPFLYQFPILRQPYIIQTNIVLIVIVFFFEAKELFFAFKHKLFRRPIFTGKAIVLTVLTMLGIFIFSFPFSPLQLIFVDRFLPLMITLFVSVLNTFTSIVKTILILLAKRKRSQLKKLSVIGVTGSYGKSSTKDLIADFLSEKYRVLKTPGSVNTDLGIAQFMLKNLSKEYEVFVVEIGAYKQGEVASVCRFVKPTIGVLTGINEQHLSLFGSMENTKKAKMELIEALPLDDSSSFALFNGDDLITLDLSKGRKKAYVYSAKQLVPMKDKNNPFLSNIAAAYLLATKLGVKPLELYARIRKTLFSFGLQTRKNGELTIIDDSFNTNPAGFRIALDELAKTHGKKILVTPGIIELGTESKRIHKELGEKIGTICNGIILTNDNFAAPLREGLMTTNFNMKNLFIPKREVLVDVVKKQLGGKAVVLFEGRIPNELLTFHF